MRTLIFDLENAPGTAFYWQARTDWIGPHMIINEPFMLSWAAKWQDGRRVFSDVVTPEEALNRDDARILTGIVPLLQDADKAVAHNGVSFDIPVLNARVLVNDLPPIGHVSMVDTLTIARKSFRLTHNNLDSLAKALGVGGKIKTDFDLWRRCIEGDETALRKMERYNRRDVTLLQDVYERLTPHARKVTRLVDAAFENERVCVSCGSESVRKDGYYRTNASTFPRYRCNDCGVCMRGRTAIKAKKLELVPVAG